MPAIKLSKKLTGLLPKSRRKTRNGSIVKSFLSGYRENKKEQHTPVITAITAGRQNQPYTVNSNFSVKK